MQFYVYTLKFQLGNSFNLQFRVYNHVQINEYYNLYL